MWIVLLALRRPYSVAVFAALIFIVGILSIKTMLVDIFPAIKIPVIGVVWAYPGLPAKYMEIALSTTGKKIRPALPSINYVASRGDEDLLLLFFRQAQMLIYDLSANETVIHNGL
jgi:multidrug efflux pump subunit AcrB